jgi:hypothetical protein
MQWVGAVCYHCPDFILRSKSVTKPELLKRLEVLVDQMKADRSFGQVSIAFRDGEPDYLRKETTEKLGAQGNSHANKPTYR